MSNVHRDAKTIIYLEQCILSTLIHNPHSILPKHLSFLYQYDWSSNIHRDLWGIILDLFNSQSESQELINIPVLITGLLNKKYDQSFIQSYLQNLIECYIDSTQGINALQQLKQLWYRNKIIVQLQHSIRRIQDGDDIKNIVIDLDKYVSSVVLNGRHTVIKVNEVLSSVERPLDGVPIGVRVLEPLLPMLPESNLCVIAGRPSTGKTALALEMALEQSLRSGIRTGFISLEMSQRELVLRLITMITGIPINSLSKGYESLRGMYKVLYDKAKSILGRIPLYLVFPHQSDFYRVISHIEDLFQVYKVRVVYIDYLQLMDIQRYTDNRVEELGYMTEQLKLISRKYNGIIVLLCQLNRQPEQRRTGRPRMSDLRGSGEIEQNADQVILLHPLFKHSTHYLGVSEIVLDKNRNGPIGSIVVGFISSIMRHLPIEPIHVKVEDDYI